jgi:inward rectifier potassium channel
MPVLYVIRYFAGKTVAPRPRALRIGDRRVVAEGLAPDFGTDLHHRAMTASWPAFFGASALCFVLINLVFATLYTLGDDPIANATPGSFADYFFFSVETIATVGYGDMHPRSLYGHFVASSATFVGISSLAVMGGLVFARFSQPRARLIFARRPVVGPHDAERVLMLRFANARHNAIADASAKLWLIVTAETQEGSRYRRFVQLPLMRDENPVFALTWTIMHKIDEASPLYGWTAADAEASDASLVVTFHGHDEASSLAVRARNNYPVAAIAFDAAYVDIMRQDENGVLRIDYGKFHDTRPAG